MDSEENPEVVERKETSSTGMDPNAAATLSYVLGWVSGLIILLLEKESRFVKFHAWQSIIAFGALHILIFVGGLLPFVGVVFSTILFLFGFALWVVMMVKAYQLEWYKLPIAGEIAENQLKSKS